MSLFEGVRVVGMHFRGSGAKELAASLTPDESGRLRLEREPENEHDANAIKVFVEEFHIGYINRDDAVWMAPELDQNPDHVTIRFVNHAHDNRNVYPVIEVDVGEPRAL